jgi:D-alanyl-D-alanine carboxypeptidase (penicillin-binding protein 5/6)
MNRLKKFLIIFISFFLFSNNVFADEIEVSSKNVVMYNLTDDIVLYEKNPDDQVYIASLTKIMTALVAIENIDDYDEKVLVTGSMLENVASDYSVAGFKLGDILSYNDLLYATLLKSGADATEILAYSISNSEENFVKLMNEKAKELNMNNTSFSNVVGIEGEKHYSSANDLLKLVKYALKNKKFKEVFTSKTYDLNDSTKFSGPVNRMNTDEELNMTYVKGAKTGYTSKAGLCLASYAKNKNTEYILITIGAEKENTKQHFLDSKTIYEYFFNNYDYVEILSKGDFLTKVESKYGKEYIINSDESIKLYLKNTVKKEDLNYEYKGKTILDSSIKKNDKIGTIYIKYDDEVIYEKSVLSSENVRFELLYFVKKNKETLLLPILTIVLIVLVIRIKKK